MQDRAAPVGSRSKRVDQGFAPAVLGVVAAVTAVTAVTASLFACGGAPSTAQAPDVPESSTTKPVTSPSGSTSEAGAPDAGPRSTDGPGAHLTPRGVLFRVWAPNAASAWVEGDFAQARVELAPEASGFFASDVAGAKVGSRYRFVLAPRDPAGTPPGELARLDPYCRQRTEERTTCLVTDPLAFAWRDGAFVRPKREKQIVYELHIGSFSKDPAKAHGTFASAKAKLADLAELGVNVIELMPVFEYGGNADGWGYNPHLHFAPKSTYGTADELRAFVDEAHSKGMAVWVDSVVNHHDGYAQAPLRCFDGKCPDRTAGIYYFGPGAYASTPWGPRPNFAEPVVKNMLLDATKAWIDEFHGDGFRWDSTSNIRGLDGQGTVPGGKELLVEQNRIARARGATSTAEDLKGYGELTRAIDKGGFGFDAQWDGFGYDVSGLLATRDDDARDMGAVVRALTGTSDGDPFARVLFTETHDTVGNGGARLPNRIDPADPESFAARRRSMLGAALLFTTPGVPMLFMGQEGLALGTFTDPPKTLAPKSEAGALVGAFYKDLVALRKNASGKTGGLSEPGVEILHRNDAAKVLVFRRHGPSGEDVIVAMSFRNRAYTRYDVGVAAGGAYRVRLTSDRKAYGADFTDAPVAPVEALAQPYEGRPFTLPLAIGAYGVVVLSR